MGFFEVNKGNPNGVSTGGVGWIIIPNGTDRNTYVANCYRMHMVSIEGGLGYSAMHQVKITTQALEKIKFPGSSGERGSAVVWIRDNFYNRPIVIGLLDSVGDSGMTTEFQQRIVQQTAEQVVEIFLDAVNGVLNISSQGTPDIPANLNIRVSGGNEDNELHLESDAKMSFGAKSMTFSLTEDIDITIANETEENIITIQGNKEHFILKDQFANSAEFREGNVQIKTEKFSVGEGEENMVLGNTLVQLLSDWLDALLRMTVQTPVGPSGTLLNVPDFVNIKNRLKDILSKLSYTD